MRTSSGRDVGGVMTLRAKTTASAAVRERCGADRRAPMPDRCAGDPRARYAMVAACLTLRTYQALPDCNLCPRSGCRAPFGAAVASIRDAPVAAGAGASPRSRRRARSRPMRSRWPPMSRPRGTADDSDLGTGRFVLLYDPTEPEAWGGPFRVICFAQAPLETDIGMDPLLADVAWSWLVDALDQRGADYTAASGHGDEGALDGLRRARVAGRRRADRAAGVVDADRPRPRCTCGRLG